MSDLLPDKTEREQLEDQENQGREKRCKEKLEILKLRVDILKHLGTVASAGLVVSGVVFDKSHHSGFLRTASFGIAIVGFAGGLYFSFKAVDFLVGWNPNDKKAHSNMKWAKGQIYVGICALAALAGLV